MKILVTGTGRSGSWAIRGEQLGSAIGARVTPRASFADVDWCDVVVAVKRCPDEVFALAHRLDKFLVWDPVDFWPQDQTSRLQMADGVKLLRRAIRERAPHGVVFATQRMQHDAEFAGCSLVLPHHSMPGLEPRPLSETVRTVGYHGGPYLGEWEGAIADTCARLGWQFLPQCNDLTRVDLAVAFRGGPHAGYCATAWKSNVKLANMQAAGVPCVIEPTAGYIETASGAEVMATDKAQLLRKFAELAPLATRQAVRAKMLEKARMLSLGAIAGQYSRWLHEVAA